MNKSGNGIGGGSHPGLAHHFDSTKQQFESAKLGMWYFVAAEIMMFSVLFCLYAVYRNTYPEVMAYGSRMLDVTLGGLSTVVLLLSSLTVALAVRAVQLNRRRSLVVHLAFTLLLAGVFLWVKYEEHTVGLHASRLWGSHFYEVPADVKESALAMLAAGGEGSSRPGEEEGGGEPVRAAESTVEDTEIPRWVGPLAAAGPAGLSRPRGEEVTEPRALHPIQDPDLPQNAHVFFSIQVCMTRIHGLHVLIGMLVIAWLLPGAVQGRFSGRYYTPVYLLGQYWHFVVIVWVLLFPLLYLVA